MNMQALLKQAQKMQKNLSQLENELAEQTYEATMGGGVVKAEVKGSMEVTKIEVAEELLVKDGKEDLEEMIKAAINSALKLATDDKDKKMNQVTGGVKMPGAF